MLVTDVVFISYWRQVRNVDDRFEMVVTEFLQDKNYNHHKVTSLTVTLRRELTPTLRAGTGVPKTTLLHIINKFCISCNPRVFWYI